MECESFELTEVAEVMNKHSAVFPQIKTYGAAYSNWAIQLLNEVSGINEIALTGHNFMEIKKELSKRYIPSKIVLAGTNSSLPLLKDKQTIETKIYICQNKTCHLPVSTVEEAILMCSQQF